MTIKSKYAVGPASYLQNSNQHGSVTFEMLDTEEEAIDRATERVNQSKAAYVVFEAKTVVRTQQSPVITEPVDATGKVEQAS